MISNQGGKDERLTPNSHVFGHLFCADKFWPPFSICQAISTDHLELTEKNFPARAFIIPDHSPASFNPFIDLLSILDTKYTVILLFSNMTVLRCRWQAKMLIVN